jgi:hypothetical protein
MEENNNQLTLYRFVSLRSPELHNKEKSPNKDAFIHFDKKMYSEKEYAEIYESENVFFNRNDDVFKEIEELESSIDEVDYINDRNIINEKYLNPSECIAMIASKKSTLLHKDIESLINRVKDKSLSKFPIARIWESLFYQIKDSENFYLKEKLCDSIVFYNLVKKFKNLSGDLDKGVKQLLSAKVVIPQEIFEKDKTFFLKNINKNSDKAYITKDENDYYVASDLLLKKHTVSIARFKINDLRKQLANPTDSTQISSIESQILELDRIALYNTSFSKDIFLYNGTNISLSGGGGGDCKEFVATILKAANNDATLFFSFNEDAFDTNTYVKEAFIYIDKKVKSGEETSRFLKNKNDVDFANFEMHFKLKDFNFNRQVIDVNGVITLSDNRIFECHFKMNSLMQGDSYEGEGKLCISKSDDNFGTAFKPTGFGITQVGLAEYRKVVASIARYEPAEVSHIENIMAKEFKEKITTNEHIVEVTDFESIETESEKVTDVSSTERFQMQTEVAKILNEQNQNSIDAHLTASYGTAATLTVNTANATNTSKENSEKQAVTNAKEITNKAIERIVSKVKKERTVKVTDKFIEVNKHGYDNREGDQHISGVYRHINAVYKNQIINYGKRLMYEFAVPEPAKLHKLALHNISNNDTVLKIERPKDPRKIFTWEELNESNCQGYAKKYNADVKSFPPKEKSLLLTYSQTDFANASLSKQIKIEEGYFAQNCNYLYAWRRTDGLNRTPVISYKIGDSIEKKQFIPNELSSFFNDDGEINSDGFLLYFHSEWSSIESVHLKINLKLINDNNELIKKWQKEVYYQIISAYEERLKEYKTELQNIKIENNERVEMHPLNNRQIEQSILKMNCISYLTNENNPKNANRKMGVDMYNNKTNFTEVRVKMDKNLDEYTAFVKFMEQAFEWNLMSYNFYPFYWANKNNWKDNYQYESNDPLFKSFMQSGMARVLVTVRPGFEYAVMYYMITGKIWEGGHIPVYGDPLYISIADELTNDADYPIEKTWETVLPTNLIALQKGSITIDQTGLPNLDKNDGYGKIEHSSSNKLKGSKYKN